MEFEYKEWNSMRTFFLSIVIHKKSEDNTMPWFQTPREREILWLITTAAAI